MVEVGVLLYDDASESFVRSFALEVERVCVGAAFVGEVFVVLSFCCVEIASADDDGELVDVDDVDCVIRPGSVPYESVCSTAEMGYVFGEWCALAAVVLHGALCWDCVCSDVVSVCRERSDTCLEVSLYVRACVEALPPRGASLLSGYDSEGVTDSSVMDVFAVGEDVLVSSADHKMGDCGSMSG